LHLPDEPAGVEESARRHGVSPRTASPAGRAGRGPDQLGLPPWFFPTRFSDDLCPLRSSLRCPPTKWLPSFSSRGKEACAPQPKHSSFPNKDFGAAFWLWNSVWASSCTARVGGCGAARL